MTWPTPGADDPSAWDIAPSTPSGAVEFRPEPLDGAGRRRLLRLSGGVLGVTFVIGAGVATRGGDTGNLLFFALNGAALPWLIEWSRGRERIVVRPHAIELWEGHTRRRRVDLTGDVWVRTSVRTRRAPPVLAVSDGREGLRMVGRRWAGRFDEVVEAVGANALQAPHARIVRLPPEAFPWLERHPVLGSRVVPLIALAILLGVLLT